MRSRVFGFDSMSFFLLRDESAPQHRELGERLGRVGHHLRVAVSLEDILEDLDRVGAVDELGSDLVDLGHAHDGGLADVAVGVAQAC